MKKLAIIGASYLQLPLVRKARQLGIETHCFAWEDGAVCKEEADFFYPISILNQHDIFDACVKIQIDGITTIATDMAVPTMSYVSEKMGLIGNSQATALMATNKGAMREAFQKGGCHIPKFIIATTATAESNGLQFPLIVKPVDRSGSRGVCKIESESEMPDALREALKMSFAGDAIIEEFIEGREVSVESISWHGNHYILAITDKVTTGSPHFVEIAHHQPSNLPEGIQQKIKKQTILALNALNVQNGAAHSEFKINDQSDVYAIEVGARMGGDFIGSHLVGLSTGYDFIKAVIDVALNQFKVPQIIENRYAGVYFLCEETRELLPYFENPNDFDIEKDIQNPNLKPITNSNDRSGFMIYQANERIEL